MWTVALDDPQVATSRTPTQETWANTACALKLAAVVAESFTTVKNDDAAVQTGYANAGAAGARTRRYAQQLRLVNCGTSRSS
jgi:hypothetical protein